MWSKRCQRAFDELRKRFTKPPILAHFQFDRRKMLETDASDYAKGSVLSQAEPDGKWHPLAFYSKKFSPAEINYDIHDKEMSAIVDSFKQWEHWLIGSLHPILVYTDHKNLEYFTTTKVLNRRQARWADYLSLFDFKIIYRPGRENGKADALSRRADPGLEEGSVRQPVVQFFKPGQYVGSLSYATDNVLLFDREFLVALKVTRLDKSFVKRVISAGQEDVEWNRIKIAIERGESCEDYSLEDGMVCYKRRIWIPDDNSLRLLVAGSSHNTKVAGHFGKHKTVDIIRRDFYWPNLDKWIAKYVKECDAC